MGQDFITLLLCFVLCMGLRHGVEVGQPSGDEKTGVLQKSKKWSLCTLEWQGRGTRFLSVEAVLLVPFLFFFFLVYFCV